MISRIVGGGGIIERTCDINYARVRAARKEKNIIGYANRAGGYK